MNYYNENDPKAAAWLRELINQKLIPAGDVDTRSIVDVHPDDLRGYTQCHFFAGIGGWSYALQLVGWPEDRPVWTGSCPCQPFSSAGKGLAQADERHLWPVFFDLIRECRPQYVFGEQVASAIGKGWLDGVSADLGEESYACGSAVLGAHSLGSPHIRQRLYWVAYSSSEGHQGRERHRTTRAEGTSSGHAFKCGNIIGLAERECLRCERIEEQRPTSLLGAVDGAEESRESVSTHGSGSSGVAYPPSGQCKELWQGGDISINQSIHSASCDSTASIGMADPDRSVGNFGSEKQERREAGGNVDRRDCEGAFRMADPISARKCGRDERGLGASGGEVGEPQDGKSATNESSNRCEDALRAADPQSSRCEGNELQPIRREWTEIGNESHASGSGATCHWNNYTLIPCRDGKQRRIESGTFPLVNGLPKGMVYSSDPGEPINPQETAEARVMRLKGYGNAIVPQVAAEFIMAFNEIIEL